MGVLEGEGGGGTVLPRLRAQVVVEARAGRHGLCVEVRREGAVLRNTVDRNVSTTRAVLLSCARKHAPRGHPEGPGAWVGRMTPRAAHSSVHSGKPGVCNNTLPCARARSCAAPAADVAQQRTPRASCPGAALRHRRQLAAIQCGRQGLTSWEKSCTDTRAPRASAREQMGARPSGQAGEVCTRRANARLLDAARVFWLAGWQAR